LRFGKFIGRLEEALLFFAIFRTAIRAEDFMFTRPVTEACGAELSRAHL